MKTKAAVLTICGAPRPFAKSKPIQILELDLDQASSLALHVSVRHIRFECARQRRQRLGCKGLKLALGHRFRSC